MSLYSSVLRSISTTAQGRILYILIIRGDWPHKAVRLNLSEDSDLTDLQHFIELADEPDWAICQIKNKEAYNKGRRLVGQHWRLFKTNQRDNLGYRLGVSIAKFQGLVEPLGYRKTPLSEVDQKRVRLEYQQGLSIKKLVDDWDVSETYIRGILKGDKPPVSPSKKSINKGIFVPEPPPCSRVVLHSRGYVYE